MDLTGKRFTAISRGIFDQPPVIDPPVCKWIVLILIWELAEIYWIRCLTMMNGMMERLSNRKWRELLVRVTDKRLGTTAGARRTREASDPQFATIRAGPQIPPFS